jgi:hypothetical protein
LLEPSNRSREAEGIMIRITSSLLLGGLVVVLVACGSSARDSFDTQQDNATTDPAAGANNGDPASGTFGQGGATPGLVMTPKNATVIIDTAVNPTTPGTAAFTIMANGKDITAGATFTLKDPSLGTFSGSTFTSVASLPAGTLGKSTYVSAETSAGQALGSLTVVQLRKTGDQRDFFFVVPYNDNPQPQSDVLKFSTNIKQVDVAFVMDTTGSMSGSISNLKSALQGSLLSQLQAAIPNVGLAVVDHKDFSDGASVVNVRQTVTTTLSLAQNAVGAMGASGGGDEPEGQVAAMQYALLGAANGVIPAHTPAAGTFGGVNFRSGSVPVVVEITDASWHDPSGNASMASLQAAFAANNAKFVNITDGNYGPEAQANTLSDATGSHVPPSAFGASCAAGKCCTGMSGAARNPTGPGGDCRLNFLHNGGSGLGSGIVTAINAIANGSSYDVKAVPSNDPKNANGVDATKFIKALRAMDEGNAANGCPPAAATDSDGDGIKDTFTALKVGTPVCFEVIPAKNTTVPPELDPQFYNAFVDVIGVQGNIELDRRSVLFLVPPKDPGVN